KTNVVIRDLAFSPDSRRLAVALGRDALNGPDPIVRVWDVSIPKQVKEVQTLNGETWGAFAVAFHPDGKTLATAEWVKTDRGKGDVKRPPFDEDGKGKINQPPADPSTI